ncbi:CinA family protein [Alteromonas sp. AMM-1]|uniref:CinA family protein n=1 Tax=Alteromonas sp. AMM-1 TaxID=3394233 RepID=UPI0039A5435F
MSQPFSTVSHNELHLGLLSEQIVQIGEHLRKRSWTVSCAESCTGGGIAYALTSVAGSSDWFNQSWVTYSNNAKSAMIGVQQNTLLTHGAVSEQVVIEMVTGTASTANSECAIAVSGIAGPGGGSADKPVGTVWFGFRFGEQTVSVCQRFRGDRQAVRASAIVFAIHKLHHWLVANPV